MVEHSATIGLLPNEILINILSLLPTRSLLPLTLSSRRIHDVILRIIHNRLLAAATLADHQVVLECYLPAAKFNTPYYFCRYLGTDTLPTDDTESQQCCTLGQLRGLYSHFRPMQPESDRKVWTVHPAGGWREASLGNFRKYNDELPSQIVDLESNELFSQLQSDVSLVKVGPRKGFFSNCINVGDGLTRIWREWLAQRAKNLLFAGSVQQESREEFKQRLLWSSVHEHTGLRIRVQERKNVAAPIVQRRSDEDENVSYTLQYEELVVRTSQLLLQVEESLFKEDTHKGMVCGLDGVYLSGVYRGDVIEDSKVHWHPEVQAF